jgi:hypothetical protein
MKLYEYFLSTSNAVCLVKNVESNSSWSYGHILRRRSSRKLTFYLFIYFPCLPLPYLCFIFKRLEKFLGQKNLIFATFFHGINTLKCNWRKIMKFNKFRSLPYEIKWELFMRLLLIDVEEVFHLFHIQKFHFNLRLMSIKLA